MDYYAYVEQLWCEWLDGRLADCDELRDRFQLDYAPEPYINFDTGNEPLNVLLTNPGKGLAIQHRNRIRAGRSPIPADGSYASIAGELGNVYRRLLKRKAAGRRISAMLNVARRAGKDGVKQFESIPFHSAKLPGKRKLPELIRGTCALNEYVQHLKVLLENCSVIALSAVSSKVLLTPNVVLSHPWLRWQAGNMGLDGARLELEPLVKKGRKVTCGFVYSHLSRGISGFVLMMGGNHFPGPAGQLALFGRAIVSSGFLNTTASGGRPSTPANHFAALPSRQVEFGRCSSPMSFQ